MTDSEKLDLLLNCMQELKKQIASVEKRVMAVENRVEAIEERLIAVENKVEAIEERVIAVENRVEAIEERLIVLENKVEAIEERMIVVESKVEAIEERLIAVESKVEVINLTLENEIRVNIRRVAEGHLDLSRNLHEALKTDKEKEMLSIRVNILETEMRKVKERVENIA